MDEFNKNFWKKVYLICGVKIDFSGASSFRNQYEFDYRILPFSILVDMGYVTGKVCNRQFTDKFIEEIANE